MGLISTLINCDDDGEANVSMAITMAVMMIMMVINTGRTSDDTGDSWTRPVILILYISAKKR